jgi:hypothetical protein
MAIARTATHTTTYTRMELIKLQVSRVLMRTRIGASSTRSILLGIENRWISEISIYGLDDIGICHVELYMKIDWYRNQFHIAAGRDSIDIDDRWNDGISIELEQSLALFEDYSREMELHNIFRVRYDPGVDRQFVRSQLGFSSADPVKWKGGFKGTAMGIPELDEFTIGINMAYSEY